MLLFCNSFAVTKAVRKDSLYFANLYLLHAVKYGDQDAET
jgi:hypothetical protein